LKTSSHPKDRKWCSIIERVNILAIGSLSLVCMKETNGNARFAITMVVSGRCPQVFDFIEVPGVAFDPQSGIIVVRIEK
jgi:hypothetical protein